VTHFSLFTGIGGIERVDLLTGGFPCQPHSLAGKRLASGDERDLWGEMRRVISEFEPRWVVGENVIGLLSNEAGRFFGGVLRDLAQMGYRVGWGVWGAFDVGAPHLRERVFLVANSNSLGLPRRENTGSGSKGGPRREQQPTRLLPPSVWMDVSTASFSGVPHGFPNRVDRSHALGNAVVPQQVYPLLKAIKEVSA
jgi:DNA (cytosine-5)-methyltransferase 1